MWRSFQKILMLSVFIGLLLVSLRLVEYYKENKLYAHFVLKTISRQYHSSIIEGYADKFSYSKGEKQTVFINPRKSGTQWIRLYDISGAVVDSVKSDLFLQKRAQDASVNGFGFRPSFTHQNKHLGSGLYLWEKVVPFIIRDTSQITVLYPSNTINAYNVSGGKSLYSMFSKQSPVISFQRPTFPAVSFHTEPIMQWLFRQKQFRFSYVSDQDMDDSTILSKTRLLIVIGHSEYWTRKARLNFDRFVDRGGNVLILSGNMMWWQVRYSKDGSKLICYKLKDDPIDNPLLKTTNWTDSSLKYPIINSIGADFALGGFGRKSDESFGGLKITDTASSIFKGTGIKTNDVLAIPTKEYDGTTLRTKDGLLSLDEGKLPFYKAKLLGFDHTINDFGKGYGSFIILKKTKESGTIINTGTADWCSYYGIGGKDSTRIQKLTRNMIMGLYNNDVSF